MAANHRASRESITSGTDNPTNARNEHAWSTHESFLTAAQMPSGMATPQAMISAVNDSKKVFHNRSMMRDVAGILYAIEYPKFPQQTFLSQKTYWTYHAWSK